MTKRIVIFLMACALSLGLCACGQSTSGQAISAEQTTWQEQYDLGLRYLSEGNYEEAIIAFTAAIEIDPKRAPAYVGRGNAYIGLGETEDNLTAAQADYEKAIELDKLLTEAYLGLADIYVQQGDVEKALDILRQGLEATGDSALQGRLDELGGTENQNSDIISKTPLTSGTLELSDFRSFYEDSGWVVENNEGAVGGMSLSFTVNGPAEIVDVLIASWYTDTPPSPEVIQEQINFIVPIWQEEYQVSQDRNVPFTVTGTAHPVRSNELGRTNYVLLIGLDRNCNAAGYAVVQESIPG